MLIHGHEQPLQPSVPGLDDSSADFGILHETVVRQASGQSEEQNEYTENASTLDAHLL